MRTIGLAVVFLLASAFGALAADSGAQGAGTEPGAQKTMQHKTMHYGTSRHHRTAVYRHGRHGRTAMVHGHRRTAMMHGHHGTSMRHMSHKTAMHHHAKGIRKASKTPTNRSQNKGKTSTY